MGKTLRIVAGIISIILAIIIALLVFFMVLLTALSPLFGANPAEITMSRFLPGVFIFIGSLLFLVSSIFVFLNKKWAKITNIIFLSLGVIGSFLLGGAAIFIALIFILAIFFLLIDLKSD